MVGTFFDQKELFLPLLEGLHTEPPWGTFLQNLVARTQARRAALFVTLDDDASRNNPFVVQAAAPRAAPALPLEATTLVSLGLHPYGLLRPERVYALEEMLNFDDPAQLAHQRRALEDMGIRYGRWMRVAAGTANAWLLLVREREDFSGATSAILSSLAPHLAAALRLFVSLSELRLRTELAEQILDRIGVCALALNANGDVIAASEQAERMLTIVSEPAAGPRRRLQLLPRLSRELKEACSALSRGPAEACEVIRIDQGRPYDLLLQQCSLDFPGMERGSIVLGVIREPRREDRSRAEKILSVVHGLSAPEAALAYGMSTGESIVEAGSQIPLTAETARNYSKRIYAKTGTRGAPDLVRRILTGLVPFA